MNDNESWDDHDKDRTPQPRHGGATGPYTKPAPDPLLDSNVDIPLDRIAREFRKRAGRAFGLGDDTTAKAFRDLITLVEKLDSPMRGLSTDDR